MTLALIALSAMLQSEPLHTEEFSHVSRFGTPIANKVIVPLFLSADDKASAVLRLERISRDLGRKGFFRVALLPQIVFENVELQIFDRNAAIDAVTALPPQLQRLSKNRALVVNGFSILISDGNKVRMTARGVEFKEDNAISFRDLSVEIGDAKLVSSAAVLQLAGERRGHLVLSAENGTMEMILFSSKEIQ